jgi:hypothetical protein
LRSFEELENFLRLVKRRGDIAERVDIIEVYDDAGTWTSFKTVREILSYIKNVTSVTLQFSFEPLCRILPTSLVLEHLTTLDVNIPHATVARFLTKHPHITNLVLGPCNTQQDFCPLTGCRLPNVWELTCPPGCVRALTNTGSPLTQLHIIHGTAQDANFPLFNFMHIKTLSVLTVLHLDFDHTVKRLLQRIAVAAPGLSILRLTERLCSEVCHSVCDIVDTLTTSIVHV